MILLTVSCSLLVCGDSRNMGMAELRLPDSGALTAWYVLPHSSSGSSIEFKSACTGDTQDVAALANAMETMPSQEQVDSDQNDLPHGVVTVRATKLNRRILVSNVVA